MRRTSDSKFRMPKSFRGVRNKLSQKGRMQVEFTPNPIPSVE